MTEQAVDRETIVQDIALMLSGRFAADHVGTDIVDEIGARVRTNARAYLDAVDELFLGTNFDAVAHSNLRLPALLNFLLDREPDRVRTLAQKLVTQYDSVLVVYDAATDKDALKKLLPLETLNLAIRLDRQRAALRQLASG